MSNYKKQFGSWIVTILIILITLEISPYIIGRAFLEKGFSRSEIKEELTGPDQQLADTAITSSNDNSVGYLGDHLLHPYLGFVSIPRDGYNLFGFPGPDPLLKADKNSINICITGGSVAQQLYQHSTDQIISNLRKEAAYAGKDIKVVVLALGGFKQPQQLLSLNYFLALGAEYDIVINLDGFNEIVLPFSDNLPFHVFPSYPRHWNIYSRKRLDQKAILQLGKQVELKSSQEKGRQRLAHSIFRHSNFMLFLWKISDLNKHNQVLSSEATLRKIIEGQESDYQSTGPAVEISDTTAFFRDQAAFWAQSSLQMANLAKGGHYKYFHFLQPNQYDKGSKVLTDEEMSIAFEEGAFNYKKAASIGYPMLREEGKYLTEKGEIFTDLSGLFKNEKRTVYSDKCCHFNQLGYDMIADRICQIIISYQ